MVDDKIVSADALESEVEQIANEQAEQHKNGCEIAYDVSIAPKLDAE